MFQDILITTPYAARMRPVFVGMLCVLTALVVARFVIYDFWGAVSLIFVCLMGAFVITGDQGMSATNALFYCVTAIISGIFDAISCVLYFQHCKYKAFDPKAPVIVLFAQSVFLLSPVALFVSGWLSYSIYTDCRDQSGEAIPFGVAFDAQNSLLPPNPMPQRVSQSTTPFTGAVYRMRD